MHAHIVITGGEIGRADNAEIVVPWWSVTKTVIAAACLTLVRDGALQLDEMMADRPYTLRQLLQHRAGLVDYGGYQAYHDAVAAGDEPWPLNELLTRIDADRLRYRPGEGWGYSNIGYALVGRILEEATGADLAEALRRLVLDPLGVLSARLAKDRSDLAQVAMGEAQNYHPGWVYHGLLVGSVKDAALLMDRLFKGSFLPASLLAEATEPFVLGGPIEGRPWRKAGYGLGLMSGTFNDGSRVVGHTGGGPGSRVAVYHFPELSPHRTVAAFSVGIDDAIAENEVMRLASQ
ncbi:serine hydrolase domain-containing protein [Microvirga flavescens]|uniref:serine hydrolase domain-containing protein n=1 Tax=Microvirga flavescens TaxID=2249811 RepID=UPI000DD6EAA9|nr:serine hydrolase domain-containing protein [Microvirga flavescens]